VEKHHLVFRSFLGADHGDYNRLVLETAAETDGIIVLIPAEDIIDKILKTLRALKKPSIVLAYEAPLSGIDTIYSDSKAMIKELMGFLISQGHKRFACCGPVRHKNHPNYANRLAGYMECLKENGIAVEERFMIAPMFSSDFDPSSFNRHNYLRAVQHEADPAVIAEIKQMMDDTGAPTAIICFSDDIALNTVAVLRALGKKVPEDVSVTGYDNIRESETAIPALTTVHTPLIQMGIRAVKRIVEKEKELKNGFVEHLHTVLKGSIIQRHSHAPVKEEH
jgi:LacI family transcriptional regulator